MTAATSWRESTISYSTSIPLSLGVSALEVVVSLTRLKLQICEYILNRFLGSTHQQVRFTVYKEADLFDFINAPVGKNLPIEKELRPLIASKEY